MKFFTRIIENRRINKENLAKIDKLSNDHMLDNANSSFKRFKSINRLMVESYSQYYTWRKWLAQ